MEPKRILHPAVRNSLLFLGVFVIAAIGMSASVFHGETWSDFGTASLSSTYESETQQKPLFSAVTPYPFVADILRQVGGTFVDVRTVEAPAAHQKITGLTSEQYDGVRHADMFFVLDESTEAWALYALQGNEHTNVIRLRDGVQTLAEDALYVKSRNRSQEYYWLSPQEMKHVVRYVARVFGERDPVHKVQYLDHAYALAYEFDDVSRSLSERMSAVSGKTFSMLGYGYFPVLEDYGLKFGAVFTPQSAAPEAMRKLYASIQKRLSGKSSEYMIADVSFSTGMLEKKSGTQERVVLLDPYGYLYSGETYIDFIEENMRKLEIL